jgi:hypothetical protein
VAAERPDLQFYADRLEFAIEEGGQPYRPGNSARSQGRVATCVLLHGMSFAFAFAYADAAMSRRWKISFDAH